MNAERLPKAGELAMLCAFTIGGSAATQFGIELYNGNQQVTSAVATERVYTAQGNQREAAVWAES